MMCKDCSYYEGNKEGYNNCSCDKFLYSEDKDELREKGMTDFSDCLVYWDGEGYMANFHVGPNFGCIHWVQK
jgi:hypothetical protein